ncbi:MAG: hypothetical protein WAV50_02750 [Minisyncoccia bacterium]
MHRTLTTVLALALFLPGVVSAQSIESLGSTDTFSVSVSPQYPASFSQATLSFLSATIDLANAVLTVSVGGKQIYQGSVRPVAIPLGRAGSVAAVTVTVTSANIPYKQSLSIQPQDVSLIAEPISSAPVLYLGKPLVPLEGSTRVVAVASMKDAGGRTIDPTTLSYTWTVDGTQIANSSGIGKQAVIVASPLQYRTRTVSVVVRSQVGSLTSGASLSLAPIAPSLRVYENDPLLGIRFDRALETYAIQDSEASLYAAPYSLPMSSGAPSIQWFLNGAAAQIGNLITLRPSGSGQGSASLSLTASAGTSAMATTNIPLSFGAKSSSNFFGL